MNKVMDKSNNELSKSARKRAAQKAKHKRLREEKISEQHSNNIAKRAEDIFQFKCEDNEQHKQTKLTEREATTPSNTTITIASSFLNVKVRHRIMKKSYRYGQDEHITDVYWGKGRLSHLKKGGFACSFELANIQLDGIDSEVTNVIQMLYIQHDLVKHGVSKIRFSFVTADEYDNCYELTDYPCFCIIWNWNNFDSFPTIKDNSLENGKTAFFRLENVKIFPVNERYFRPGDCIDIKKLQVQTDTFGIIGNKLIARTQEQIAKAESKYVREYSTTSSEYLHGLKVENLIISLLHELEGVRAWRSEDSCEADCIYKWDVFVEVKGKIFPLQIKSSSEAAHAFIENNENTVESYEMPFMPVVVWAKLKCERAVLKAYFAAMFKTGFKSDELLNQEKIERELQEQLRREEEARKEQERIEHNRAVELVRKERELEERLEEQRRIEELNAAAHERRNSPDFVKPVVRAKVATTEVVATKLEQVNRAMRLNRLGVIRA